MIKLDESKCQICFACVKLCPFDAMKESEKGPVIDHDKCTECNRCVEICPEKALTKE